MIKIDERIINAEKELADDFKKAEEIEQDKDSYCEFMKGMILNTYSAN